jgi:hypothetical protein
MDQVSTALDHLGGEVETAAQVIYAVQDKV